ncbi:MerR family transcriptional regulator [Aerococcaceae bacterium zg-ZJ1578]|uniref:MerR family transcriptional regulator n=1 Tax=Aerococcaceae bacterium zg-252 TaxID=2796928 RepID=UPI001A244568|nr:MerR family transcriptional regulator [Aerococcaceae bacterium zg-1578]
MKEFQIGHFASNLGVTPDLLKHYEKFDLIQSKRNQKNLYRFYAFSDSQKIFDIKTLQNFGFSLAEIKSIQNNSMQNILNIYEQKRLLNDNQLTLQTRFQQEFNQQIDWLQKIQVDSNYSNWSIQTIESFYFMQHTKGKAFTIQSDEHRHAIKDWINLLPITKSTAKFHYDTRATQYGFSLTESEIQTFNLPCDTSYTELIPKQKCFLYDFVIQPTQLKNEDYLTHILAAPKQLLESLNLSLNSGYIQTLLVFRIEQQRYSLQRLIVPIH